jgi:TusA-related sulfurtransferase
MNDDVHRDYRGTVCPMNFVKVKLDLSKMSKGQILKVLLDDGEPIENVPRSVKLQGDEVVGIKNEGDHWSVVIRKC